MFLETAELWLFLALLVLPCMDSCLVATVYSRDVIHWLQALEFREEGMFQGVQSLANIGPLQLTFHSWPNHLEGALPGRHCGNSTEACALEKVSAKKARAQPARSAFGASVS